MNLRDSVEMINVGSSSKTQTSSKFALSTESRRTSPRKRKSPENDAGQYTPFELQFCELKKKYKDVVLFIETGYFYRLFGDDAKIAEEKLNLRVSPGHNLITASFSVQSLHVRIRQLASRGYKVGVVKRSESALIKATGDDSYGICKRELASLYTKSTLIGEELDPSQLSAENLKLDHHPSPFLLCLHEMPNGTNARIAFVAVCLMSGDIVYDEFIDRQPRCHLQNRLDRLKPAEIILPQTGISDYTLDVLSHAVSRGYLGMDDLPRMERLDDSQFLFENAQKALEDFYSRASCVDGSHDYGILTYVMELSPLIVCCIGAMLVYLKEFQLDYVLILIKGMKKFSLAHSCLYLNEQTLQKLQLLQSPKTRKSLLRFLDRTSTVFGSKLLMSWLSQPLNDSRCIQERLDAVEVLRDGSSVNSVSSFLEALFAKLPDLENGITSIFYKKCGTKKYWTTVMSFVHVKNFITAKQDEIEREIKDHYVQRLFFDTAHFLYGVEALLDNLNENAARNDDKTRLFNSHTMFPALTAITEDINLTKQLLNDLLPSIARAIGKETISYSKFSDKEYVVVVEAASSHSIPQDWIVVARTTRSICCRTEEVEQLTRRLKLLRDHFKYECHLSWIGYLDKFKPFYFSIKKALNSMATLDCLMTFANLAKSENFSKPVLLSDSPSSIIIQDGWHPLIADLLGSDREFVRNDTYLGRGYHRCQIVTGPNMGGKSCYMESIAITVILAQIGCFVPARHAEITVLDSVLLSTGVRDNLFKKRSTFFVEAEEVSKIVKQTTPKSLVLLDEFGRSTSDSDGASLACGVVKYLANKVECLSVIVTQFHEVTLLAEEHADNIVNFYMTVYHESTGNPVYLYKLQRGVSDKSFAGYICQMVGIDDSVISCAEEKSRKTKEEERILGESLAAFMKIFNERRIL